MVPCTTYRVNLGTEFGFQWFNFRKNTVTISPTCLFYKQIFCKLAVATLLSPQNKDPGCFPDKLTCLVRASSCTSCWLESDSRCWSFIFCSPLERSILPVNDTICKIHTLYMLMYNTYLQKFSIQQQSEAILMNENKVHYQQTYDNRSPTKSR